MGPFRKLLLVGVGVIALYGLQACANDELNPQPLPPQTGGEGTSGGTQEPSDPNKSASGGDTTNGAGGTPPAPQAADAGADGGGDAADGGDG